VASSVEVGISRFVAGAGRKGLSLKRYTAPLPLFSPGAPTAIQSALTPSKTVTAAPKRVPAAGVVASKRPTGIHTEPPSIFA
jgi:hypothetical protein